LTLKNYKHLLNRFSKAIFALKSFILECKKTCWPNPVVRA
jgi:hypothetical protein